MRHRGQDANALACITRQRYHSRVTEPEIIILPDARRMAVHHFGDPEGAPMLFIHGWPSDASMGALVDSAARSHHFRVLAPDRPGIGRSDPQPDRTLSDWPADVRALAAHYGIGNFAVVGISGGGPYALATAHAMPERITATAIVCGAPPLNDPATNDGLLPIYRLLLRIQRAFPRLLRFAFRAIRPLLRHIVPDACLRLATRMLPPPDRTVLSEPRNFAVIFDGMRRSWAACPDGVYDDAVLYTLPWNFEPAQIRTPIAFWHGAMDVNFHPHLARKLAARIPGASLHIVPGEGHYSLPVNHAGTILASLARTAL